MDVVAVDWSGASAGASSRIWLAHVIDGELIALRNGRTRQGVTDDLVALRSRTPDGLIAGLDFSFSFPSWFLQRAVLLQRRRHVADWRPGRARPGWPTCAPPFWGRPGRPRPSLPEHFRRAERRTLGGRHLRQEHVPSRRSRRRGHRFPPGHAPPPPTAGGGFQRLALRPALPLDRARDLPPPVHRARPQEQPGTAGPLPRRGHPGRCPSRSPHPWSAPKMRSTPRFRPSSCTSTWSIWGRSARQPTR